MVWVGSWRTWKFIWTDYWIGYWKAQRYPHAYCIYCTHIIIYIYLIQSIAVYIYIYVPQKKNICMHMIFFNRLRWQVDMFAPLSATLYHFPRSRRIYFHENVTQTLRCAASNVHLGCGWIQWRHHRNSNKSTDFTFAKACIFQGRCCIELTRESKHGFDVERLNTGSDFQIWNSLFYLLQNIGSPQWIILVLVLGGRDYITPVEGNL